MTVQKPANQTLTAIISNVMYSGPAAQLVFYLYGVDSLGNIVLGTNVVPSASVPSTPNASLITFPPLTVPLGLANAAFRGNIDCRLAVYKDNLSGAPIVDLGYPAAYNIIEPSVVGGGGPIVTGVTVQFS